MTGPDHAEQSAPADKVIPATSSPRDDRKIRLRLQQIFSEIETLRAVGIDVSNGIVTLQGEIDSSATEAKALQLARQVDGVVEVQNALMVNRDLKQRLQSTQQKLLSLGKQAVSGLPVFLLAMFVSRYSGSLAPGCHTDNASFVHSRRIPSLQVCWAN